MPIKASLLEIMATTTWCLCTGLRCGRTLAQHRIVAIRDGPKPPKQPSKRKAASTAAKNKKTKTKASEAEIQGVLNVIAAADAKEKAAKETAEANKDGKSTPKLKGKNNTNSKKPSPTVEEDTAEVVAVAVPNARARTKHTVTTTTVTTTFQQVPAVAVPITQDNETVVVNGKAFFSEAVTVRGKPFFSQEDDDGADEEEDEAIIATFRDLRDDPLRGDETETEDEDEEEENKEEDKRVVPLPAKSDWFVHHNVQDIKDLDRIIDTFSYNDPILCDFLQQFCVVACKGKPNKYFMAALQGLCCNRPVDVFDHYTERGMEVLPPKQVKKNRHEFGAPSDMFNILGKDCLMVIDLFLNSCQHNDVSPDRWIWDFILCSLMEDLESSGLYERSPDRDAFSKLVCLVLSGNTKDETCIRMTTELARNGFLDVEKMARADLKTLQKIIKPGGYHMKRAGFLKNMAQKMIDNFEGKVPDDLVDLMSFDGIARKTAVLTLNEALGKFEGIGTDVHVIETVKAFGFIDMADPKQQVNATHAEASLRTWVPKHRFPVINKLFGSFSQLFTQNIPAKSARFEDLEYLTTVCRAAAIFRSPYHVSLLFCMIHSTRRRYRFERTTKLKNERD